LTFVIDDMPEARFCNQTMEMKRASSSVHATSSLAGLGVAFLIASFTRLGVPPITAAEEPDRVLVKFQASPASNGVLASGSTVSVVKSGNAEVLRVATGHDQSWPGVTLKAPDGDWNLADFDRLLVDLKNAGTNRVTLFCRVDNPGADGTEHCVTDSLSLEPGRSGILRVMLKRASDSQLEGKLFGMRGYPVAPGGPGTVDPTKINQLLVFVSKPSADHVFEISQVRAHGRHVPPTAWAADATPFFPFIDTFGQYKHKDWAGKLHSLTELEQRRQTEAKELSDNPAPPDWDRFGGWAAGPQLKATGFFRTEKFQGKWWLVDPDGRLFFSQGIDCVQMRDVTPVAERESWFEDFPGVRPEFQACLVNAAYALKGHYAGRSPMSFSFGEANLQRKYGENWREVYPDIIHRRLRSWGLNSVGMWSDLSLCLKDHTPYVDSIGSRGVRMIEGSEGYWGKFPDVWDTAFRERLRQAMSGRVGKSVGDPWCLGYFADNEMSWGDENSLALGALHSSPDQPAKQEFANELKEKYSAIENLNAAWGTVHSSWEALLQSTNSPNKKRAYADLTAFYSKTTDQYFRTVREVIKERAPHQLYLGCRFAWVNPLAAVAAAKFCDVVSYNLYRRGVADFQFNGGTDVPLMIGEFHFGALDRGMFHTGLVAVRDQAERAQTYRDYVTGALRHPNFVGCHWFQYQDEPVTGRGYDEENYQIGFIDVADTPYRETVEACRDVARNMYRVRVGAEGENKR
jgi:hypothetical protein